MIDKLLTLSFIMSSFGLLTFTGTFHKIQKVYNKNHNLNRIGELRALINDYKHNFDEKLVKYKRVCYYLLNKDDKLYLQPNDIDPYICTHIIIGYATIDEMYTISIDRPEINLRKFRELNKLKKDNNGLKLLISIKINYKDDDNNIDNLLDEKNVKSFVDSIIDLILIYNLDGIDINLEQLTFHNAKYLFNLIKFIKGTSVKLGKNDLITTLTVGYSLASHNNDYYINEFIKEIDFINLKTYDYHYFQNDRPYTGHHSSLFRRGDGLDKQSINLNTAFIANLWLQKGVDKKKIIIGLPTFARTFNLAYPNGQGFDAPAIGNGIANGTANYTRVCEFIKSGAIEMFDVNSQVPFAYKGYDWIAFENEKSVAAKARWVVKTGYGGIMTFTLNDDDWKGTCRSDQRTFPLQKSIARTLELSSLRIKHSSFVPK